MNKQNKAKIMLCLSMIIFGTIGLFTKGIAVTSGELAFYRVLMGAVILAGYFCITKKKIDFAEIKKEIWLILLSGMALGVNWIFLFEAYKYTTISAATLSYYFAPVLVMIISPFLFRERITGKQILCFVMSTVGLVLIVGFEGRNSGGNHLLGILLGLGAAVFYAVLVLCNMSIKISGIQRTLLQFAAAVIVLLPYVLFSEGIHLDRLDSKGWICLLIVGIVHTVIAYCMYFSAIKELKGQEVSILSYLDPLVAVLGSVVILGEEMGIWQVVGGILILGFTLWSELTGASND